MAETATEGQFTTEREPDSPVQALAPATGVSGMTKERALEDFVASRGRERATLEDTAAQRRSITDSVREAGAARDAAAQKFMPPTPVYAPPPPQGLRAFLATEENENPMASIAKLTQALALFAGQLGGALRKDAGGALAAWTGAMEGWKSGDRERADRAFKEWQEKNKTLKENYDTQRTQYQDILTNADKSFANRVLEGKLLAMELDDKRALAAFDSETPEKMFGYLSELDKLQQGYDLKVMQMQLAHERATEQNNLRRELAEQRNDTMLQVAGMNAQARRDAAEAWGRARAEMMNDQLAPGVWFDKGAMKRVYPTKGEVKRTPEQFHQSNQSGETRMEQIEIALPMIKQLRTLVPKLLATQPVENLLRAADLALQGKTSANPDLREFEALVKDTNVKMTSVMGPGQFRVTLLKTLEGAGVTTRDTVDTAQRLLNQWETNIENDMRAIAGAPLREHVSGPWQGWAKSPTGERKWIRIPRGERIDPGWVTVEETR